MSNRLAVRAFGFVSVSCLVVGCGGSDDGPPGASGASGASGSAAQAGNAPAGAGAAGSSQQQGGSAGSSTAGAGPQVLEGRLAAGSNFACGIGADQAVVCWGAAPWSPNEAVNAGQAWVGAGGDSKCTVSGTGALRCRGDVPTPPAGTFAEVVVSSDDQACALTTNGSAVCWGDRIAQWQKPTPSGSFEQLAMGLGFACGIDAQSTIECWGAEVPGIPTGPFSKLYASGVQVCALRADGSVACWGTPLIPLPATALFTQLALGSSTAGAFLCGLALTGRVTCYGKDSGVVNSTPDLTMAAIAAADSFVCGVTSEGSARCWGASPPSPPASFKAF